MANLRRKTLRKYVIPSMLTNACYFFFTVVDGLFVGNGVGNVALGAVNIALPFTMLVFALGMLTSSGGAVLSAISFGEKKPEAANQYFLHSVVLTFLIALFVMAAGNLFTRPVALLLGADEAHIGLTEEYIFWWSLFAIPTLLSFNLQGFCRNDGSPSLVAVATVVSTAVNIFLDWLFVFPWNMGVMGAAIATGIAQSVNMLIVLAHFLRKKGKLRFRAFRFDRKAFAQINFCGFPEMLAQYASPIITICMNQMLGRYLPAYGIDVFAVISYVTAFSMAIIFGTAEGLQPLFGQSFGAREEANLRYYLRSGLIICIIGSAICVLGADLFAKPISLLFGAEPWMLREIVRCMPQYSWAFVLASVNTLISSYLYSTKNTKSAIFLNILRSFVVSALSIIGLTCLLGAPIIWHTFGISELVILAIALVLMKKAKT